MELRLLGHAACALITPERESLVIDPYESGGFGGAMAYAPITLASDWVICSHQHLDHCATHLLPGEPTLIEGEGSFGAFHIKRHEAAHDEYDGRRRGGMVDILEIVANGVRVVHLGAHHPPPSPHSNSGGDTSVGAVVVGTEPTRATETP